METRKTPDKCFVNLPDYDFEPHYVTLDDDEGGTLDMHYIEAGPANGQPVVMIHGNPTWSFMWRIILRHMKDHVGLPCIIMTGWPSAGPASI